MWSFLLDVERETLRSVFCQRPQNCKLFYEDNTFAYERTFSRISQSGETSNAVVPPPPPGCIASSPPSNALTQHRLASEKPQQRHFSLTVEQRPLNEQMERPSSVLLVALHLQPASIQATTALRKTTLYSACRHCT